MTNKSKTPGAMVLVPREPTEAMKRAGLAERHDDLAASIYKAMIAAAPAEQTPAVGGEPERYDWDTDGMNKDADGHYVRHGDVAPLLTEIERLKEIHEAAKTVASGLRLAQARIAELEAQQGEPVAWIVNGVPFTDSRSAREYLGFSNYEVTPLYRKAQPAEAKVVLPERKRIDPYCYDQGDNARADGWNACIDEVARLNGAKQ